jgi:arylsulfatase
VPARDAARHLVLLTVDTYRSDHFLSARAGVPLTPELAELAARSIVFRQASSVSNATSPGVAGILTGLTPHRSGVLKNVHMLPATVPTLAAALRDHGFRTAAYVGNPVLAPGYGFERGFDTYELIAGDDPRPKGAADALTTAALGWLERAFERDAGRERIFLWVHFMDPHGPYRPPAEFLSYFPVERFPPTEPLPLLPPGDNSGRGGVPYYQQLARTPASRSGPEYLASYAGEVRFLDSEIGRLLRGLDRLGITERAVVALTSDHGEALLNDHGYFFSHANGLTQDQVHVPLLLRCPGCAPGVLDRPVSTVDIVPTVLDRLGVAAVGGLDGRSLLQDDVRPIILGSAKATAVREGAWKLIVHEGEEGRLYNLHADPGETRDLALDRPEEARRLAGLLADFGKRPRLAESRGRARGARAHEKKLRALGYVE